MIIETGLQIAAGIAPEPRYTLVSVPGVELTPSCPQCDGTHTLPNCPAFAAGAGTPLIAGLRAELAQAQETIKVLSGVAHDAHALLYHYDLARQPNGVDWGPVEMLRAEQVDALWSAICLAQPEMKL